MDREICTVDSLKEILDALHNDGYGDMYIVMGVDTPVPEDAIGINYCQNKLTIRNRYYDEQLLNAARNLRDSVDEAIQSYISDCYCTAMNSKDD